MVGLIPTRGHGTDGQHLTARFYVSADMASRVNLDRTSRRSHNTVRRRFCLPFRGRAGAVGLADEAGRVAAHRFLGGIGSVQKA